MNLESVPLIPIMRELHRRPRNRERFREYLRTIFPDDDGDDQLLPLLAMNPMGREHVTEFLVHAGGHATRVCKAAGVNPAARSCLYPFASIR